MRSVVLAVAFALAGCVSTSTVWFGASPDRRRRVEIVEHGEGEQRVVLDGVAGPAFLGVGVDNLAWSPDGARLAYAARTDAGWSVVVDGAIGPSFDGIGPIVWSPTSRTLAYAAARGESWILVEDGKESPPWDQILVASLTYSHDGERFAYVVEDGVAEGGAPRFRAVVDGVPGPPAAGIGELRFTEDSRHYAYLRRQGVRSQLVFDGVGSDEYEAIASYTLDETGATRAFVIKTEKRWHVVVGDIIGPAYERITNVLLSKDGRHWVYAAKLGPIELVVRDGIQSAEYEAVRPNSLRMSNDGARWAFVARQAGSWSVIENDRALGWYPAIGDPVFAGDVTLFTAKSDLGWFVVRDRLSGNVYAAVGEPVASGDGAHSAYLARMGSQLLVVRDGEEIPVGLALEGTLAWSRDGKRLGCVVGDADARKLSFWIDGALRPFDQEELAAALMKPSADTRLEAQVDADLLRRWVSAELER